MLLYVGEIEHAGLGDVHDSSSMSLLGSGILCFLIMHSYHTYAYESMTAPVLKFITL